MWRKVTFVIFAIALSLQQETDVLEVEDNNNVVMSSEPNDSFCLSVELQIGVITIHRTGYNYLYETLFSLSQVKHYPQLKVNIFVGSTVSSYLQTTQFYSSQYIIHLMSQDDWDAISNRTVHERANFNYGRVLRSSSSSESKLSFGSHIDKVVLGIPYITLSDTCAPNSIAENIGGVFLFEDDVVFSKNIFTRLVEAAHRLKYQGINRYILSLYMPDFEGKTKKRVSDAKYTYITEIKDNFSCTQAVYYPESVSAEIGQALLENHHNFTQPYDKYIESYCRENNIKIYGITMVQHIGRNGTGLGSSEHTANFFDVNY